MAPLFLRFVCVIATASLFAGCATTSKPRRETLEKPGIIEEDIRVDGATGDRTEEKRVPDQPSAQLPAQPPVEPPAQPEFGDSPEQGYSRLPDGPQRAPEPDYTDEKRPRRFIWRDRENGRKSWKPAPDDEQ